MKTNEEPNQCIKDQNDNFKEIKAEILRRAHEADACREQYGRAYKSETLQELMQGVKDNRESVKAIRVVSGHTWAA